MPFATSATRRSAAPATASHSTRPAAAPVAISAAALDPLAYDAGRPARPATPSMRLSEVAEMMRASPYRVIAVVEPADGNADMDSNNNEDPVLVGLITERALVDLLLGAQNAEERARLRSLPVREFMEPPDHWITATVRASEAAPLLDRCGMEALPVVRHDTRDRQLYLGLLSRSDLVQELTRPFRPPHIGGFATPTGVYLTTGDVSGGVGTGALVGAGLALCLSHTLGLAVSHPLRDWGAQLDGLSGALLRGGMVPTLIMLGLYLAAVRLSAMSGYHAAEHQVIHAIERGEPLLVETVKTMPRVHPRCGTNVIAGLAILLLFEGMLAPLIARAESSLEYLAWIPAGIAALIGWRRVGSWLQKYVTTRPATDRQIENGIQAAREVLERHSRNPEAAPRFYKRIWRIGFLQIFAGDALGCAILLILAHFWPALDRLLGT